MATNKIDVYVKLSSGKAVQYDLDPSNLIEHVISHVAKDEGVASNQVRLKYQGKILVPNKSIGEYGVRAETILKSEVLVPKSLALVINQPDGTTEELSISNLESTKTLIKEISDKTGISEGQLEAECKGQKLTSSSSSKVLDFGIENCAEINVKRLEKVEAKPGATNKDVPMDEKQKESVLTSFQTHGKQVEVVFSFDTTGSMYQYLEKVRTKLNECCTRLIKDIPNIRIGLIAHGDYCDQHSYYVLRSVDLTNDVDRLVKFAWDVPSSGGGDAPECYEWALRKAQHLDWAEDSAKALVMIGDERPHAPSYTDQKIQWRDELDVLRGMGVKVYGVQCGQSSIAEHFYAEMADVTDGRHLRMSHFDVITDMFLAVCYREGSEELLEEFQQELEGAGRMSEQTAAMFKELTETEDEKNKKKEKKREERAGASSSSSILRHLGEWWDSTQAKDEKDAIYTYDEETDVWSEYRARGNSMFKATEVKSFLNPRKKKRGRCTIM